MTELITSSCKDCDQPFEHTPSKTRPRRLCDACRAERKAKTAIKAKWGKVVGVRCSCGIWFNRCAASTETTCSPCRGGPPRKHGIKNTYGRGCRCAECVAFHEEELEQRRIAGLVPKEKPRTEQKKCLGCDEMFTAKRGTSYCSGECRGWERGVSRSPGRNHKARARYYEADYEPVDRRKVFRDSGWTCGICDEPVDSSLKSPDPHSASLDHIIPMSRGGAHLYGNVQCAHLNCNIRKSNLLDGETKRRTGGVPSSKRVDTPLTLSSVLQLATTSA